MEFKSILKKNENWIIALLTVALLGIFAGINFDYYYDLNDDVLMKDILAGAYTGTPEGHNIQMLWLVSAGISLLYRIAGSLLVWNFSVCMPLWLPFSDFAKKPFICGNLLWKDFYCPDGSFAFWRIIS